MVGITWLAWAACTGGTDGQPRETGHTGPSTGDDDDDDVTGGLTDDGSVVLAAWQPYVDAPDPTSVLSGLFVESDRDWLNLAQCVSMPQAFCLGELPQGPGDSVLVSDFDPTLIDQLATRDVGDPITLGPISAPLAHKDQAAYYWSSANTADLPSGPLGLHVAGDWPPYDGTSDVVAPDPMVVTSPDPSGNPEFYDSGPIHLTWTPGTTGTVYLLVGTPVERRLYELEDTGSYDLDLTSLGLPDRTEVDLMLGRWSVGTAQDEGSTVRLMVQSNQQIHGTWRTFGARDPLTPYDECADAEAAAGVAPGHYVADLRKLRGDLDPGNRGCTNLAEPGQDGLVPVDLGAHERLTVTYTLAQQDAGLYLLTDCGRVSTCVAGSDSGVALEPETIQYLNGDDPQRVYVVLDSWRKIQSDAYVDLDVVSVGGDVLSPTCAEAMARGPAQPGTYNGSIAGNADLLEPSCVNGTSGGEGLTQIDLLPNQTLTATVTTPTGNPTLYLMYNCAIADSCFQGENSNRVAHQETLSYTNTSGFSEFVYLAVDGSTDIDQYVLDLAIQ